MEKDIRKTGPVGLKGVNVPDDISQLSLEDQWKIVKSVPNTVYSYEPEEPVGIAAMNAGYGDSRYDEGVTSVSQLQNINDIRYANQSGVDVLANGVVKMLGTAGTTFLSSLVGMPAGIATAIGENRWSGLWDNSVTQGLADVDEWMEKNFTNYQSQAQQQDPSFRFGDMNWWADSFIKNIGFTIGAAGAMATAAGGVGLLSKSLGIVNNVGKIGKTTSNFLSSLFAATGEGSIEAVNGVRERNKLETQRLNNELAPYYNAIEEQQKAIEEQYLATGDYNTYNRQMQDLNAQKDIIDSRRAAGEQQIEESGKLMGNKILLANQALLTAGNLIQFGKTMSKSFDNARHAAKMASKYDKPFGVSASRVSNNLKDGYKISGKNLGRINAATKGLITEGSEEMNQQFIQSSAGIAYNEKDVNDYWRAKLDPDSYRETTKGLYTLGNTISQGFKESWGDIDQWEQFLIGGLTGAMGIYAPTKIFNQDKTKSRLNPLRYGEWSGGAYNELQEFNDKYNQYQENIDDLNKILQSEDFPERVSSLIGHTYTEEEKTQAAENNDKKAWKDAEDKQLIHDIQAFARAGKISDLRAIYNEMGQNISDEDIEGIYKSTTKEISAEEDKANHDAVMDTQIAKKQEEINKMYDDLESMQNEYSSIPSGTAQLEIANKINDAQNRINSEEENLKNLQEEKNSYVGKKTYEGPYVNDKGDRTKTPDEIREIVKHNAEELNRKLDSYLESVNAVQDRTNGVLTKDQEDNLAYLHNLSKESINRMTSTIKGNRSKLPSVFLFKTDKTPEQLNKKYASSDLTFTKDENTKEGYVKADTSLMKDAAFASFLVSEIIKGGNIRAEFAETAQEREAREEEERNLSPKEKAKRKRERTSKKWQEMMTQYKKDADDQVSSNWNIIVDSFFAKDKNNGVFSADSISSFEKLARDLGDAVALFDQSQLYEYTLDTYMNNPELVDKDKEKEVQNAEKETAKEQAKKKFANKSAQQIKQEISQGNLNMQDVNDFIFTEDSDVSDVVLSNAKDKTNTALEGMQKAASLKKHIQDSIGENPTPDRVAAAEAAMQAVDDINLETETPNDINIDSVSSQITVPETVGPLEADIDNIEANAQDLLASAFSLWEKDEHTRNSMPNASSTPSEATPEDTGHDSTTKAEPVIVAPQDDPELTNNEDDIVPESILTSEAFQSILNDLKTVYSTPVDGGTWRSTTTRYAYGSTSRPYHDILKGTKGENSIEYKRSKAIYDYLVKERAFDKLDDTTSTRIKEGKEGDIIHFMVKYMPEIYDNRDYSDLSDEEKTNATVIFMVSEEKGVLGDLPLAEWEPSYKNGTPTEQVKQLKSFQDLVFAAFQKNKEKSTSNEAIVDSELKKEGADNLNLTFKASKRPIVSKVKQVARGTLPTEQNSVHTLNAIMGDGNLTLGVRVLSGRIAIKRKDKEEHSNIIVPKVGSLGQPYILFPTQSGELLSMPFYMERYDANKHRDTNFYKMLSQAIYYLVNSATMQGQERTSYFEKHIDVLEGLLQVKRAEEGETVVITKNKISLHLQSLTDPDQKIDIEVPNNNDYGNASLELANALSGIPINVSLNYINDIIAAGPKEKALKFNYNRLIGEIANANIPENTQHTVNGWFTIELSSEKGLEPSRKMRLRTSGKYSTVINGRDVEIDADTLTATDKNGEPILDDPEIDLALAVIESEKPGHQNKDIIQVSINGETRRFDVKNKKFLTEKKSTEVESNPIENPKEEVVPSETQDTVSAEVQEENKEEAPVEETPQMSIEEIEDKAATKDEDVEGTTITVVGIVNSENKDAWDAIPRDLKLKLMNDWVPLELTYDGKTEIISRENMDEMARILTEANSAAIDGSLSIEEAAEPMKYDGIVIEREKEREARKWMAKNLPMLSSEERLQFVDKLARGGSNAERMWGNYRGGVIEIKNNAPIGTVYHEAFHYVLDMLLDSKERTQILDIAKKEYGENLSNYEAEERLANDFRRFAMDENATGIIGTIKKWFRKIKDKIMRYDRISNDTINQLFWKINNGELAQKSMDVESFDKTQQIILREIRNVQQTKYAWNNLSAETKDAFKSSNITQEVYESLSLEEKEQYVRCRG